MGSITHHITPLVINSLGCGHTNTHIDVCTETSLRNRSTPHVPGLRTMPNIRYVFTCSHKCSCKLHQSCKSRHFQSFGHQQWVLAVGTYLSAQLLTTLITRYGCFCFKKLFLGIASASEQFQTQIMSGLNGIIYQMDDGTFAERQIFLFHQFS